MTKRYVVCLLVFLLPHACFAQSSGTKQVVQRSEDGTQTGGATVSADGTSAQSFSSSSGQNSAFSSTSLTVTSGGGAQASYTAQGDEQSVQGTLSTDEGGSLSTPKATEEHKSESENKEKPSENLHPGTSSSPSDAFDYTATTDEDHTPTFVPSFAPLFPNGQGVGFSYAETSLIPGDASGDNKNRICVTTDTQFKEYLAKGFEVTLIRKASGGNVEILREVHSTTGRSRSKIITSIIPQDVKDLCGVTEETFGIKQRDTGYSFSSSSSSSSTSSGFSSSSSDSQGSDSAHHSSLDSLCSSDKVERFSALKKMCETHQRQGSGSRQQKNEYDIKHEYG